MLLPQRRYKYYVINHPNNKYSDPKQNPAELQTKLLIYGYRVFNNYPLYPTGKIRPESIKYIASYTEKLHNCDSKISWYIVSNAAERFNISQMVDGPASNADRMSFWTLIKTVYLECLSLYADCSGSNMLFLIKCSLSLPDIIFSITFEINVKFDKGRQFSRLSLSQPVFFKVDELRQS